MKKPNLKHFALITGSSSGIGKEIALKLSQKGFIVFINYKEDEVGANEVKNTGSRLV
ncbi:MAG TPA: SDR family NAD(P)-dependent oxidoreductase [Candidatus Dojkabacteria bacterium]|nr:SDR family NAD(P)-dependent oxidoreductase [Candidatus Dojkabacteria bacterium]